MKKILALTLALGINMLANGQGYQPNLDRAGAFFGLGINSLGGAVESQGSTKSMKGGSSLLTTVGGYYELAVDKNLSFIVSLGLGYTSFNYSYSKAFNKVVETAKDTTYSDIYLTDGKDVIKRTNSAIMLMPQLEIAFMSNPIKDMYIVDFRLGFGSGFYLNSKSESTSENVVLANLTHNINYVITESVGYRDGNKWSSGYGLLYLGMRWSNTTNDFLNRSSIGLNITFPFGNARTGGAEVVYSAQDWDQTLGKEEIKFNLMSYGLKYAYNFKRRDY